MITIDDNQIDIKEIIAVTKVTVFTVPVLRGEFSILFKGGGTITIRKSTEKHSTDPKIIHNFTEKFQKAKNTLLAAKANPVLCHKLNITL